MEKRSLQYKIRNATERDLPALEWEGEYRRYRRVYQRAMREAMEGRQVLLVAEADGRIIGQIFIQLQGLPSDPRHEPGTGYFYAFRVRPEYRNRGIGTALMEAAEASLKMAAYHRALIGVAMKNYAARRLYERRGYSLLTEDSGEWSFTDHRDRVYRIAEPTYIMEKRLDLGE